MSKVGVYIRVSTLDQIKGLKSQESAIREYLKGHDISSALWFRDVMSGKDDNRPGLKALKKAIFNGKVDTVIIWKLDRLSRTLRDGIETLCRWVSNNIRVVSVTQQLDFSGPAGKMVASVLFALAEMERENIRENTKRGLRAAQARGVRLGRPRKHNYAEIRKAHIEGESNKEIILTFGLDKQTLHYILYGKRRYEKEQPLMEEAS
jgi:DNA invertase Pin-like site-specific DNA recombinase